MGFLQSLLKFFLQSKKIVVFFESLSNKIKGYLKTVKETANLVKQKGYPKFSQWRQILKVLEKKETISLLVFFIFFLVSSLFLIFSFYYQNTEIKPARGGVYIEAVLGRPRFINPIYASSNDADRDLVELLFSGLMKYDGEGKLVPDLAKTYEIEEEGRVYEFSLKDNIIWHDGKKFSIDDIIFTIKTIQNPDYKSPQRSNWLGVEVEKINENTLKFSLKNPYPAFLENTTLKILPKHIWQDIPSPNFPLSVFNLQPTGTGPYRFKNLTQDKLGYISSLTIELFPKYFKPKPFIPEITFHYYDKEEDMISILKKEEAKGLSFVSPQNSKLVDDNLFSTYFLSLPRYFALFLNPKESKILGEKNIRQALNYGTNKEELIQKVLFGKGEITNSPILPEIFGFNPPAKVYEFNPDLAKSLLEKAGFKDEDGDGFREKAVENPQANPFKSNLQTGSQGTEVKELQKCLAKDIEIYPEGEITGVFGEKTKTAVIKFQEKYRKEILEPAGLTQGTGQVGKSTRAKLNELCGKPPKEITPLKFSLITVDQYQLIETANLLKKQWENLGIKTEIKAYETLQLQQDFIKPRAYEILLFGEVLGCLPDPFSFWHSSQKREPGLNLSDYENKEADKLLEETRQSLDFEVRRQKYEKFQDILIEDAPAVFLYSPDYLYPVNKEIKGVGVKFIVDPSKRFSNIENWYIKTKRTWR